jgi:transcription elongation GreA/GreB family factor
MPAKDSLRDELTRVLRADLEAHERAHDAALEGATHEEARPENDKDTRALEQSYLARGEAARVEQLRAALAQVQSMRVHAFSDGEPASLGALVTLEEGEAVLVLWIAPHGGGSKLAGGQVQVVTPQSALGRAILGSNAGEDIAIPVAGRVRELKIVRVE